MISNSNIKAAWVAKLKSLSNITALVPATEIREVEWKGTDFTYPNIRVKLGPLRPTTQNVDCRVFSSDVSILIFSEQKSSKQADDIAGVVTTETWAHGFTSNGIKVSGIHLIDIEPADVPEGDQDVWRSVVNLKTMVQSA